MEDTAFVAELFRAANEVEKIPLAERRRLLEQATETISRLRMRATRVDPRVDKTSDILVQIQHMCEVMPAIDSTRLASTFLACAEVIRTLRIFIEADNL